MKGKVQMKKVIALVLALCTVFTLCACGAKTETPATPAASDAPAATEGTSSAPVEEPAKEYSGTVMLYSSMAEDVLIALQERFHEIYPKVQLDYYQAGSGKVTTKLTTELQAGSVSCDVVWLADASEFVEYKEAGNLIAYESPYAATVPEMFKDPDNAYIGARAVLTGFCYAPDTVGTVPTAWEDLLKEEYKGNILMTDAGASGSMKTWLYAIANCPDYGWEFIEGLKANGLELESGTSATHNKVATGAYKVGIGVDFVTKNLIASGSNIGWQDVTNNAIAYYSPIAIVKGCPDEELAKLLYDFIMNPEEGQVILANNNVTPVQPATPIPEGMYSASWIAENALYVDVAKMAAESAELLAKYDALFKS